MTCLPRACTFGRKNEKEKPGEASLIVLKASRLPLLSPALEDLWQEVDLRRNYMQTLLLLHLYFHRTPTLHCSRNAVAKTCDWERLWYTPLPNHLRSLVPSN